MASLTSKFTVDICELLSAGNVRKLTHCQLDLDASNVLQLLVDVSGWKTDLPLLSAFLFTFVGNSPTKDMMLSLLPLLVYRVCPFFYEPVFIQRQTTCPLPPDLQQEMFFPYVLNPSAVGEDINYFLVKNEPYDNFVIEHLTLQTYMASQPSVHLLYVYVLQVAIACQTLMWSKIKHNRLTCEAVDLVQLHEPFSQKVVCGRTIVKFNYDDTLKYSVFISKLEHAEKVEEETVDVSDFITFFKDFYLTLKNLYHMEHGQKMNLLSLVTRSQYATSVLAQWDFTPETASIDTNILNLRPIVTPPISLNAEKTEKLIDSYALDTVLQEASSAPASAAALAPALAPASSSVAAASAPAPTLSGPSFVLEDDKQGVAPKKTLIPVLPRLTKTNFSPLTDNLEMFLPMKQILLNLKNVLSKSRFLHNNVEWDSLQKESLTYRCNQKMFHPSGEVKVEKVFQLTYLD